MERLASVARPLLLIDAALLLGGVLLTAMNMLLIGWSVYLVGQVVAIVAFLSIGAMHRDRMDGWSWAGLLVVEVGLILAIPQTISIWQAYSATPTDAVMQLPSQTDPIGPFAELVFWIGLAFFGLAARGAKVLPAGVGWMFLIASVIGLAAAFFDYWFITPYWWVLAMFAMVLGLVAVAGSMSAAVPASSLSRAESR
jgi:hypothetical protein